MGGQKRLAGRVAALVKTLAYSVPFLTRGIQFTGVTYYKTSHSITRPEWLHCWDHMHHHEGWKLKISPVTEPTGYISAHLQDPEGRTAFLGSKFHQVTLYSYDVWLGFLRRGDAVVREGWPPGTRFTEPIATECHPPYDIYKETEHPYIHY